MEDSEGVGWEIRGPHTHFLHVSHSCWAARHEWQLTMDNMEPDVFFPGAVFESRAAFKSAVARELAEVPCDLHCNVC